MFKKDDDEKREYKFFIQKYGVGCYSSSGCGCGGKRGGYIVGVCRVAVLKVLISFSDIDGYNTVTGTPMVQKPGAKTLGFYLFNQRGFKVKVTLWRNLGDDLLKKNANSSGIHVIILTSTNSEYYNVSSLTSDILTTVFCDGGIEQIKKKMTLYIGILNIKSVFGLGQLNFRGGSMGLGK